MPRPPRSFVRPAALCAALAACGENQGIDPSPSQLYFPIAAAVDGNGRWLYVVNSNFDLRFNGGTVFAINLSDRDAEDRRLATRVEQRIAERQAAGTLACNGDDAVDETPFIRADQTRKINPFAVDAAWASFRPPAGPEVRRLYVLVRGDGSLTWLDTGGDGSLGCGNPTPNGACTDAHRAGIDPASPPRNDVLPPDPSALSVTSVPSAGTRGEEGWITVVHQSADPNLARATLFRDFAGHRGSGGVAAVPTLLNVVGGLAPGLSAVAALPPVGDRPTWVATSRSEATLTFLQAYPGNPTLADGRPFLYRSAVAPVPGLNTGSNNRAVAIDPAPDRRRAFVVSRSPESLLALDLSNATAPVVTDVIPLAQGPSRLVPVYDPHTRHTTVYVVSFDARRIYVVDPDQHRILHQIFTRRGPHTIVRVPPDPAVPPRFLYVVDFTDSTFEVIDVETRADGQPVRPATYQCRVLTVGIPSPPEASR